MDNIQLLNFKNIYKELSELAEKHLEEYVDLAYWGSQNNYHQKVVLPTLSLDGFDEEGALFSGTVFCRGYGDDYNLTVPFEFMISQECRDEYRIKVNEAKDKAWKEKRDKEEKDRNAKEIKDRREYERLKSKFAESE